MYISYSNEVGLDVANENSLNNLPFIYSLSIYAMILKLNLFIYDFSEILLALPESQLVLMY